MSSPSIVLGSTMCWFILSRCVYATYKVSSSTPEQAWLEFALSSGRLSDAQPLFHMTTPCLMSYSEGRMRLPGNKIVCHLSHLQVCMYSIPRRLIKVGSSKTCQGRRLLYYTYQVRPMPHCPCKPRGCLAPPGFERGTTGMTNYTDPNTTGIGRHGGATFSSRAGMTKCPREVDTRASEPRGFWRWSNRAAY